MEIVAQLLGLVTVQPDDFPLETDGGVDDVHSSGLARLSDDRGADVLTAEPGKGFPTGFLDPLANAAYRKKKRDSEN